MVLMQNQEGNFFIRNNRYRSTVQSSTGLSQSDRYQSNPVIGPVTPVFRTRYYQTTISKGPSQLSVNSNPFDDEYETISEICPQRTSIRHSARKKRRAPQPPISVRIKLYSIL